MYRYVQGLILSEGPCWMEDHNWSPRCFAGALEARNKRKLAHPANCWNPLHHFFTMYSDLCNPPYFTCTYLHYHHSLCLFAPFVLQFRTAAKLLVTPVPRERKQFPQADQWNRIAPTHAPNNGHLHIFTVLCHPLPLPLNIESIPVE